MSVPVTIVHTVPGGRPVELATVEEGVSFSSVAVGGFGDCSVDLDGDWRKQLGYLGTVRILYGSELLWEGQLEDKVTTYDIQAKKTTFRAFGLQRLLTETTVRRIWSKRDISWQEYPGAVGATVAGIASRTKADASISTGAFNPADLSKQGVRAQGDGTSMVVGGTAVAAYLDLPANLFLKRFMATVTLAGSNTGSGKIAGYLILTSGTSGEDSHYTTTQAVNVALSGSDRHLVYLGAYNDAGTPVAFTTGDTVDWTDIRLLCTALTEDDTGGFYGGTILRDLVALIPGLTVGIIEDGSDFTIQSIERAARDTALSVVQEVAGYYTREWAVWDNGRTDWRTRNLDEPQWVIGLADTSSLELDESLDGLARTVYVLYSDAASGVDAEASAVATDQRNPYVRQARAKDVIVSPGFPMTANTASQLATTVAGESGTRPPVTGTITLPANRLISNLVGAAKIAALIRGGDNVLLADMPKTDPFQQGRDGETLFHVASSTVDLSQNTVTLELEGQQQRTDVILARLAAATRLFTG